ncbi:MAG: hypothetical protein MUF01_01105 [Bryobacterales bacterium]|jgi:hypothetical protein|nr:hypothetical protein [Bryobacterales bacterium]
MAQPQQIQSLEIVGFAEQIVPEMLPVIVPPVYRARQEPHGHLVPPFREWDGVLYGATEIGIAELEDLEASGRFTKLPEALPARPAFELWFDDQGERHYQPIVEATERLRAIAHKAISAALEELSRRNFDNARRHAGIAISADDRLAEPFAIRAAIDTLEGQPDAVAVQRMLFPGGISDGAFQMLVDGYEDMIPLSVQPSRIVVSAPAPGVSKRSKSSWVDRAYVRRLSQKRQRAPHAYYHMATFEASQANATAAIDWLERAANAGAKLSREHLESDADFGPIQAAPEFIHFLESLPAPTESSARVSRQVRGLMEM